MCWSNGAGLWCIIRADLHKDVWFYCWELANKHNYVTNVSLSLSVRTQLVWWIGHRLVTTHNYLTFIVNAETDGVSSVSLWPAVDSYALWGLVFFISFRVQPFIHRFSYTSWDGAFHKENTPLPCVRLFPLLIVYPPVCISGIVFSSFTHSSAAV